MSRLRYRLAYAKDFKSMQNLRKVVFADGYSLKPFDDQRSIFIHVPKCAGVSINRALFGCLGGGHRTLNDYLLIFEPKAVIDYFKFTIVRNPWDRLVSAYFFLKGGGLNENDRNWYNRELCEFSSFDDFVKGWLNKENIWKWYHFMPQYHFILDRQRRVSLDFVGFIENIKDDFMFIAKRIGATSSLPQSNEGSHGSYMTYYTTELCDIVADVYEEDIKLLGYNFDNSSLPRQIAERTTGLFPLHAEDRFTGE